MQEDRLGPDPIKIYSLGKFTLYPTIQAFLLADSRHMTVLGQSERLNLNTASAYSENIFKGSGPGEVARHIYPINELASSRKNTEVE